MLSDGWPHGDYLMKAVRRTTVVKELRFPLKLPFRLGPACRRKQYTDRFETRELHLGVLAWVAGLAGAHTKTVLTVGGQT